MSGATDRGLDHAATAHALIVIESIEERNDVTMTSPASLTRSGRPTGRLRGVARCPGPGLSVPEKVDGVPPTMVISLTNDPTTPIEGARRLQRALGGALLTVDGDRHTIAATGTNPCVNDAVAAYLVDGRAPAEGSRCAGTS